MCVLHETSLDDDDDSSWQSIPILLFHATKDRNWRRFSNVCFAAGKKSQANDTKRCGLKSAENRDVFAFNSADTFKGFKLGRRRRHWTVRMARLGNEVTFNSMEMRHSEDEQNETYWGFCTMLTRNVREIIEFSQKNRENLRHYFHCSIWKLDFVLFVSFAFCAAAMLPNTAWCCVRVWRYWLILW